LQIPVAGISNYKGMKIIVSLTSWNKRIDQAKNTVDSILKQTRKADLIRLNLDFYNFPKGFGDTPKWVNEYLDKYDNFKVKFEAADMKVWEKIIPTVYEEEGDYILVTVDDDVTYPETYLEEIEENMKDCDWLCTKSDEYTMGQYMAYGPRATTALSLEVDYDFMKNVPLDDHGIYWILQKYKCKRGHKIKSECQDRQAGYSFRRFFMNTDDEANLQDTSCDYPFEEFKKERAYMRSRGI
jgi:hypothetical protein